LHHFHCLNHRAAETTKPAGGATFLRLAWQEQFTDDTTLPNRPVRIDDFPLRGPVPS
jgi:hypothetical protein